MNRPPRLLILASAAVALNAVVASAQVNIQPTPQPIVTAENETWSRSGEPIAFAGNLYYPAGPATHFNANEMVRSGFYQGIPLYSKTTIEPYSVVFVPIGAGRMQPYERRRAGELAGTSGSSVASLPVGVPPAVTSAGPTSPLQAPAPPVAGSQTVANESAPAPLPPNLRPAPARTVAAPPVGTAGRAMRPVSRAAVRIRRPASNGIFVEFDRAKWFSSGPPVSPDSLKLVRIGEWRGFPVYAERAADSTIYIPIAEGLDALAPYSKRR